MIRSTSRDVRRQTTTMLAAALISAAALGLSACGHGDENEVAIRQAKIDLETLGATNVASKFAGEGAPVKKSQATYAKVIADLSKAAESSRSGEAIAARLLRARAYSRQAEDKVSEVASGEKRSSDLMLKIRTLHDSWLDFDAQAQALTKYNPAPAIKELEDQITAKAAEIEATKGMLAQTQDQLKKLESDASAALDKSKAERDRELQIRNQAVDKTQTERAELIKKANEAKRASDGFDKQAADLNAQASKERPTADEYKMRISRLEAQKTMLEAAKQAATDASKVSAAQANRDRKGETVGNVKLIGAEQVGTELVAAVNDLKKARADIVAPSDDAAKLFQQASAEAGRAKSPSGRSPEADLATANAKHAEADLYMVRAGGEMSYAELLASLAATKPALPNAGELATLAGDAEKSAKHLLEQAQLAFNEAKGKYESSGSASKAADVKERLESVTKSLASFAPGGAPADTAPVGEGDNKDKEAAKGGDSDVAVVKPSAAPTTAPTSTPAAAPEGAAGEVVAALQKMSSAIKASDYDALMTGFIFRNQAQQDMFKKMVPVMKKTDELNKACTEAYGKDFETLSEEFRKANNLPSRVEPWEHMIKAIEKLDASMVDVKMSDDGQEADVTIKNEPTLDPISMKKRADGWAPKLDMNDVMPDDFLTALVGAIDKVLADVKGGKYKEDPTRAPAEVLSEMRKAVVEAAQKKKDENK